MNNNTKSCHQLIINITLSEDRRKDKKLVKNVENSPFYDFVLKCGFQTWLSLLW